MKETYWQEKYLDIVKELLKHTDVPDGGQFREDVKCAIACLAEARDKALAKLAKYEATYGKNASGDISNA